MYVFLAKSGKTLRSQPILKKTRNFHEKVREWILIANIPLWHFYHCSSVTLLRLFHSDIVAIVPKWHCYNCSTVALLRLFHSDIVTTVRQWDCCDCSTVALLRLFHSDTVTIVPQWHCCNFSTMALLRLFHSGTVTIVPYWHCYNGSLVTALRYKFYGLLTLFHSEIHCWRVTACTRNTTHDSNSQLCLYPVHFANVTRYSKKYTILIFWTRPF